jgi:hypothetical protein
MYLRARIQDGVGIEAWERLHQACHRGSPFFQEKNDRWEPLFAKKCSHPLWTRRQLVSTGMRTRAVTQTTVLQFYYSMQLTPAMKMKPFRLQLPRRPVTHFSILVLIGAAPWPVYRVPTNPPLETARNMLAD